MRTLVLLVGLCLFPSCDGDVMSASPDLAFNPDLAFSSSCGFPGDAPVNNKGVGKFCQEILDCKAPTMGDPNWKVTLCSTIDPTNNSHFCTFICTAGMTGECGSGALCVCNGLGCGCAPAKCTPPDGGTL